MVHFDHDQKISQIRLFWDQGSLLKQIDVIGARARNWPIRDGKEQSRLIATSANSVEQPQESSASSRRSAASQQDDSSRTGRPASSRSNASHATNDPHATLNLFQARDTDEDTYSHSKPAAPRAQSAKPKPREMSELFVGEDGGSPSPQRSTAKAGSGKNYQASRLFEEEEPQATPGGVKTNSKKYDHFEIGQGQDDEATPKGQGVSRQSNNNKGQASWNFEDFVTPEKTKPKVLAQAVRHFGWSDDEVGPFFQPEFLIVVCCKAV